MNAAEVLVSLGKTRVPGSAGVITVVTVLPVEVALTEHATDGAMRRAWRDRQGGRATPLLVVHDAVDRPGFVRVLGPGDARPKLRPF